MDEIDAALDFRNVSVIADYIKDRTKDSQFIIISLRNQMFENANELIGIYKTFDITKVVIFNPNAYDVRGNPIVEKKKENKNENRSEIKSKSKSKSINMEDKSEIKDKSFSLDEDKEDKQVNESEKDKEKEKDEALE